MKINGVKSEKFAEADFTETMSFAAVSRGCRACEEQDRNPFIASKQENILINNKRKDKGEPVLYKKELKYTDCPYSEEPYKCRFDYYDKQQTLILFK